MTYQSIQVPATGATGRTGKNRVTATEWVDGVEYRIVLEREGGGKYREVSVTPVEPIETGEVSLPRM